MSDVRCFRHSTSDIGHRTYHIGHRTYEKGTVSAQHLGSSSTFSLPQVGVRGHTLAMALPIFSRARALFLVLALTMPLVIPLTAPLTGSLLVALDQPSAVVALPADTSEQVPCGGAAVIIGRDGSALSLLEALPASAQKSDGQSEITVVVAGGLRRSAIIQRRGTATTAVLLKIKDLPTNITPIVIGDGPMAKVGDVVWTAGNAFGAMEEDGAPALSRGIISGHYDISADSPPVRGRAGRELSSYRGEVLEIDAAINDGNQGGAVVDDAGRLIGLASLGTARPRKLGTTIPIHLIARDLALSLPVDTALIPPSNPTNLSLVNSAGTVAPGLALVYMERINGPGNPESILRPPRLVDEVPKHERERMERWWNAYYHQQQMFYTDQAVTAMVIDAKQGLLLTANSNLHGGAKRGEVLLPSGAIKCTVLARNLPLDLALLKADTALPSESVNLAASPQLSLGQPIAVVGRHRGDNGFTCTTGVVSTIARRQQQTDTMFVQTDAMANYGSLGGAVVDVAGAVVGMMVLLGPDGENLPWAINSGVALFVDSGAILRALPMLREGKTTRRAPIVGLGIQMSYRRGEHPLITGVTADTGAAMAGIMKDDILMSVDGIEAMSPIAVTRALIRHRIGDVVPVTVERNGDKVTVQVVIRAFSDDQ
jgi:S1-C subfamily serine protease